MKYVMIGVISLVERQIAIKKQQVAIMYKQEQVTYEDLGRAITRLSMKLIELPGCRVLICMERSIQAITAILAVLKSNKTFIPIDPNQPRERVEYIVSDTNVSIIITTIEFEHLFSFEQKICLDGCVLLVRGAKLSTHSEMAYCIYTSGTTGNPKGVLITNQNLLSAYQNWETVYNLPAINSHLQMANISFDVFIGDIVRCLGSGAKLIICPKDVLLDSKKLLCLLQEYKIECAEFVPTILRRLMALIKNSNEQLSFMKLIICGSDTWMLSEYFKFKKLLRGTRLVNSYGMTEATIDSTYYENDDDINLEEDLAVPIGKPFPSVKVYILDTNLKMVETGHEGEIYIGGACVGQGYVNMPELTAKKFIENPFCPGEKIYHTGDRGSISTDGNINFFGRLDTQVKINGYRIELSAIEALINDYFQIRESRVFVETNEKTTNSFLSAEVVLENKENFETQLLKQYLSKKLPRYMVPRKFYAVTSIPLSLSGKINRKS